MQPGQSFISAIGPRHSAQDLHRNHGVIEHRKPSGFKVSYRESNHWEIQPTLNCKYDTTSCLSPYRSASTDNNQLYAGEHHPRASTRFVVPARCVGLK
eukprot:760806-Hanusia_phi.AAC.4